MPELILSIIAIASARGTVPPCDISLPDMSLPTVPKSASLSHDIVKSIQIMRMADTIVLTKVVFFITYTNTRQVGIHTDLTEMIDCL